MIGNIFGLLVTLYFLLLFIASFFGAVLYRYYILPYLGKRGYSDKAAYRRITEYRQISHAEKLLKNESILFYLAVKLLKNFERISLRNPNKVTFGWVGLAAISFICVAIGI